ncbi:MAG: hypothetical protein K2X93_03315 [Candidatus Obscuribacterales bacterium]|nr:hypothetical protein [Candidatus Obscuribacterales bacterium]
MIEDFADILPSKDLVRSNRDDVTRLCLTDLVSFTDRLQKQIEPDSGTALPSEIGSDAGMLVESSDMRLRVESLDGKLMFLIYPSEEAALARKEIASIGYTYKSNGSVISETRVLSGGNGTTPKFTTETTIDKSKNTLTVTSEFNGKTSIATFADNGLPTGLVLLSAASGAKLQFIFENGKIKKVLHSNDKDGSVEELKGEKFDNAVNKCLEAMQIIARDNGFNLRVGTVTDTGSLDSSNFGDGNSGPESYFVSFDDPYLGGEPEKKPTDTPEKPVAEKTPETTADKLRVATEKLAAAEKSGDAIARQDALVAIAKLESTSPEARKLLLDYQGQPRDVTKAGRVEYARLLANEEGYKLFWESEEYPFRKEMFMAALDVVNANRTKDGLNAQDAGFCVKSARFASIHAKDDPNFASMFVDVLSKEMDGKGRTAVMTGIFNNANALTINAVREIYLRGVDEPLFAEQLERVEERLRGADYRDAAHQLLIDLTTGVGDAKVIPGKPSRAEKAASLLNSEAEFFIFSSTPERVKAMVDDLYKLYKLRNKPGDKNGEHDKTLVTLARVAANLPAADIKPEIFQAIAQGYKDASGDRNSPAFKDARAAMLAVAKYWTRDDALTYLKDLTPDTIHDLKSVIDVIPPAVKRHLATALSERYEKALGKSGDTAELKLIGDAMRVLKDSATPMQLVKVFGKDSVEIKDSTRVKNPFPDINTFKTLWEKNIPDWGFPEDMKDSDEAVKKGEVSEHELGSALAFRFLSGKDPDGLRKLRDIVFDNSSPTTADIWCRTEFVVAIAKIESGHQSGDKEIKMSGLVDLMALRRSNACITGVKPLIDRYIKGEQEKGRITEQQVVQSVQLGQLRFMAGFNDATSAVVDIVNPNSNAEEIKRALDRFLSASRDADLPIVTASHLHDIAVARYFDRAVAALDSPEGLKNPKQIQVLRDALESIKKGEFSIERTLHEAFGGRDKLQQLIDRLDPAKPDDAAAVRDIVIQTLKRNGTIRALLTDADSLRRLPLTPQDLMRADVFCNPETADYIRDFGSVKRMQETLERLSVPAKANTDYGDLKRVLTEFRDKLGGPGTSQFVNLFGGRDKIRRYLVELNDPQKADAVVASLKASVGSKPITDMLAHFDRLRDNPGLLTDASVHATIAKQVWTSCADSLESIVRPVDTSQPLTEQVVQLRSAADKFFLTATTSGDPQLKGAAAWVSAFSGLTQLSMTNLGFVSASDRIDFAKSGLTELLRTANYPENKALIEALGGKEALEQLIKDVDKLGWGTVQPRLKRILDLPLVSERLSEGASIRQLLFPGKAFRELKFTREELLRSSILTNPESMSRVREALTVARFLNALEEGVDTAARCRELSKLTDEVSLLQYSQTGGKQLLLALGGAKKIEALKEQLKGLEQCREYQNDPKNRDLYEKQAIRTDKVIKDLKTSATRDEFKNAFANQVSGIRPSEVIESPFQILRPSLSPEDLARAVDLVNTRRAVINGEFSKLEEVFLIRGTTADAREESLKKLEQMAITKFAKGGDDLRLLGVPDLRAVHQLLKIQEAKTPEGKAKAIEDLIALVSPANPLAQRFVSQLETKKSAGEPDLLSLMRMLERGSAEERIAALEILRLRMPSAETESDVLRTQAVMRDLLQTEKPTVEQLDKVRKRLEDEVSARNVSAVEWLEWADANRHVLRLSANGGGPSTQADRVDAVKALSALAKEGNPHAQQALYVVLASTTDGGKPAVQTDDGFAHNHPLAFNFKRPLFPDMSHLKGGLDERLDLARLALDGIEVGRRLRHEMTSEQARVLALALGSFGAMNNRDLAQRAGEILDLAWRNSDNAPRVMDGVLRAFMDKRPGAFDRRTIADFLIKQADQAAFAARFGTIIQDAGLGDKDSLYVLTGVLARSRSCHPDVLALATKAATRFGDRAELRQDFLKIMLEYSRNNTDFGILLPTMGEVAAKEAGTRTLESNLSPLVKDVRTEIARQLKQTFDYAHKEGPVPRQVYQSALKGLLNMCNHLRPQDVDLLTREITPELAEALKSIRSPKGMAEIADLFVQKMFAVLNDPARQKEWISALESLGHLGPCLQVNENANHVRDIVRFMNIRGAGSRDAQLAAGRTLLLITANGATPQVREEAAKVFAECGWAKELGADVSKALVEYAQGKDVSKEMVGKISELVYGLNIKPPIAHLLRMLQVTDVPQSQIDKAIEKLGKGDRALGDDRFRQLLAQVQSYNSLPKALQYLIKSGGTDVSTITASDLMTGTMNKPEEITSTKIKEMLGQLEKDGSLTGNYDLFNEQTVNQRLKALTDSMLKTVGDRTGLSPDEAHRRLIALRTSAAVRASAGLDDLAVQNVSANRKATMDDLCATTKKGHDTSYWWYAAAVVGYPIARQINQGKVKEKQDGLITELRNLDAETSALVGDMRRLNALVQSVDLARGVGTHFMLTANADRAAADVLILDMATEHNPSTLAAFAPLTYNALVGTGTQAWERGAWGRLYNNGLTSSPVFPTYSYGMPQVLGEVKRTFGLPLWTDRSYIGTNYDFNSLRAGQQRLVINDALRAINTHPSIARSTFAASEISKYWGEVQVLAQVGIAGDTRSEKMVDHVRGLISREMQGPARDLAMEIIREPDFDKLGPLVDRLKQMNQDGDPVARFFMERLQNQNFFAIWEKAKLTGDAADREKAIKELRIGVGIIPMEGLQPAIEKIQLELPKLKETCEELKQVRDACQDSTARAILDDKVKQLEKIIQTFDPQGEPMKQFREMIRLLNTDSFGETDFGTWLRDKVIPTLAVIGYAAFVAVSTFGAGTPLAIAGMVMIAGGGILIREGYAELSYQLDWNGTGGSQAGDAYRRYQNEKGLRESGYMVYNARTGQLVPGPTWDKVVETYGKQFATDMVLQLVLLGYGHVLGKGLSWITGATNAAEQQAAKAGMVHILKQCETSSKGLHAAMTGLPKAEWPLVYRWLTECGHQGGFGIGSHATQDAIQKDADKHNFYSELTAAVLVLTVFTAGRSGYRNIKDFGSIMPRFSGRDNLEIPVDKVAFMKEFAGRIEKSNLKDVVKFEELPNGNVRATLHGKSITLNFVSPDAAVSGATRPTFEGATGRPAGDGSKLPRDLVEGKLIEVDGVCRKQVEDARVEIEQSIGKANLPDAVAGKLRELVGERPRSDANPQIMTEYARRLALVHDIVNMTPELRQHFVDPALKKDASPSELRRLADTARLTSDLIASGVPWEVVNKYLPELLAEVQPFIDMLPPAIRKAFIDPVIMRGLNPKEFHAAFAEAVELARLSRPDQIRDIAIKLETATGDRAQQLTQLLMETARQIGTSPAYVEAIKLAHEKRTADQNTMVEAVERVKSALKIPEEVWNTQVKPALTKPDISIETFNKVVGGLRKPVVEEVVKAPEIFDPPRPENFGDLKPFKVKTDVLSDKVASVKKVQEAAEQAEAAAGEMALREGEFNLLLQPEIQRLQFEFPDLIFGDCHTIAMARLAVGSSEARLQKAHDQLLQAKARVQGADAQLSAELTRFTESLAGTMNDFNTAQKGQTVRLAVKYSADPQAVAGYHSKTGELILTPDILKLPPEQFGAFMAREMSAARTDFELAFQLAFSHLPPATQKDLQKIDTDKLQADFKARTGRELNNRTLSDAINAARSGKIKPDGALVPQLEASAKSTKVADYAKHDLLANRVSAAHLEVQQGKVNQILDRLSRDAAYARDVFGEPLPTEVRALVEQLGRSESVDVVTAKKVLTEALNANLAKINARMKSLFEGMTSREKLAIAEGQAGGNNVKVATDSRAKLQKELREEFAGNEPWKVRARELLEATRNMSEREADFVLNLLRLRALKESKNDQYKKETTPDLDRYLETLDLILAGGLTMPTIAAVAVPGKTRQNMELVRDLTALLKTVGRDSNKAQKEAILGQCIKDLIPIQPVIVMNKPELAERALQVRYQLNATLNGRGIEFKGLTKEQLSKMRNGLDETLSYNLGKNGKGAEQATSSLTKFMDRVNESIQAIEAVRQLAAEGKVDRANALAEAYACAELFPNAAFPFKTLTQAALNPDVPLNVLRFVSAQYKAATEGFEGLYKQHNLGGDSNNSLSVLYAMARCLPGYETWIYIPTGKQSTADHGNIDGIFLDTMTGQVRPIDFFALQKENKKELQGKDFWAKDDKNIGDGPAIVTSTDCMVAAQKYIIDFMKSTEAMATAMGPKLEPGATWRGRDHLGQPFERSNDKTFPVAGSTGFTPEFVRKVGFLPFKPGRNPDVCEVTPKDVAAELKVCQDYYKKLCDYMLDVHARDGAVPAHVVNLAMGVQNLMSMLKMADIAYGALTLRLIDPVSPTAPKAQANPDGSATVVFNSVLNTSSRIKDFQGNILVDQGQGFIPALKLYPDGRITAVAVAKDSGTLLDAIRMKLDHFSTACLESPTRANGEALARIRNDLLLVQREIQSGKADFTKPPLDKYVPAGFEVRPDGKMMTKASKKENPMGTLPELLEVSIDRLNASCVQSPTAANLEALARLKSELAFIKGELAANRKLDYSKPPLADLVKRLGGK